MWTDKNYVNTAMRNRGKFAEQFAVERLSHVFGAANVYPNIDIYESKGKKIGEIDVLVLFGDRALVLQAKSKKLTLEARRGNDLRLRDDFKKSIQDSCNQAYLCAGLLEERKFTFTDANSKPIQLPENIKQTYVICLISDHYPALSFQARQFLSYKATETISPPFVLDVFALDAITEMLDTPLRFLSYVDIRTGYIEKILASHELTILSYHLKQNLWLEDEYNAVLLSDDISADLDVAMLVRRESIPGERTPDGILTRFTSTTVGQFVKDIERHPNPATIALGFTLLTLSEQTVREVNDGIDYIVKRALNDGKSHDFTVGLGKGQTGLTIHCNNDPIKKAEQLLYRHCTARKYSERSKTWFGICIRPADKSIRFGLNLEYEWEYDRAKEDAVADMPKPAKLKTLFGSKQHKVGRNEPCPCGSGKKFKKCCLG